MSPPTPGPTPDAAAPLLPPGMARRRCDLDEWMDRADCDPVRLANTYRQFPLVNRWIARWPALYRRHLRPLLDPRTPTRLLDVGCGGGDVPLALARQAARDGLLLEVTAIDPDPRGPAFAREEGTGPGSAAGAGPTRGSGAAAGARRGPGSGTGSRPVRGERTPVGGVSFRQASTTDLVREGARFDVVICNHVLHHLEPGSVATFLGELMALATRRVLVSDIERSGVGYLLFSLGTPLLFRNSYIRTDGLVSIRRSFTAAELQAVVPPRWTVERLRPWRLLALWDREGRRG